jgi:hypothetical protein
MEDALGLHAQQAYHRDRISTQHRDKIMENCATGKSQRQ